jgi:hypothetical protein
MVVQAAVEVLQVLLQQVELDNNLLVLAVGTGIMEAVVLLRLAHIPKAQAEVLGQLVVTVQEANQEPEVLAWHIV